jgi:hypothetical protein
VIALRREETGVLVMELSENFWPEDLELAVWRCMILRDRHRMHFCYLL